LSVERKVAGKWRRIFLKITHIISSLFIMKMGRPAADINITYGGFPSQLIELVVLLFELVKEAKYLSSSSFFFVLSTTAGSCCVSVLDIRRILC
jgi:hypothetical protein